LTHLYFVRHGQAGTRHDYEALSPLGRKQARLMWLAGALHNTSYTILKRRREGLTLFSFNSVPHLPTAELRTHR